LKSLKVLSVYESIKILFVRESLHVVLPDRSEAGLISE
jgi:hypothetical protein